MNVAVHLLPAWAPPEDLEERTVVVVDILRATTTMTQALAAGATEIIPCLEVADARATAARLNGPYVLGGERGGLPIAGFHLGNSPREYSAATVGGRTVVFTTTNGTRALHAARRARNVVLGAFSSLTALATILEGEERVAILCAGTDSHVTLEDGLFAGALLAKLGTRQNTPLATNDEGWLALAAWHEWGSFESAAEPSARLIAGMRHSRGGRNLIELGLEADLAWAARLDTTTVVGRWEPANQRVVRWQE